MAGNGLPYGLQAMLKEGHKHLSGLQEAVLKNVEACKQLSQITRSSMGPNGISAFASRLSSDIGLSCIAASQQQQSFAALKCFGSSKLKRFGNVSMQA